MELPASSSDVETVQVAVQRLIESRNNKSSGHGAVSFPDDDGEHQLLAKLLSQLESLKADGSLKHSNSPGESKEVSSYTDNDIQMKNDPSSEVPASAATGDKPEEEIIKELKDVKRQNTITHRLMYVLLFLTAAWQLSELSMAIKVKNGLTHPFRSLGDVFKGMFKRSASNGMEMLESHMPTSDSDKDNQSDKNSLSAKLRRLSGMDVEKLPYMDLPGMVLNGDEK